MSPNYCWVEVTWTCQRCMTQSVDAFDSSPHSDPVLNPPTGWDYGKDENTWLCPDCLTKEAG